MFQTPNRIIRASRDAHSEIHTSSASNPLVTIARDGKGGEVIQVGYSSPVSPKAAQSRTERVDADIRIYTHLPGIAPSFHFLVICAGVGVVALAIAALIEHARPYFEFQPAEPISMEASIHA